MIDRETRHYGPVIVLHWFMALLIAATFSIGVALDDLPMSPAKFRWIAYHKWTGVSILGLLAVRVLFRLSKSAPAVSTTMTPLMRRLVIFGHITLYLLMFSVPFVGWLMSSAYGMPVVYLKLVRLPDLIPANKPLAETLSHLHAALAWSLAATVTGHIGMALKHQFIDRDNLLSRMGIGRAVGDSRLRINKE